MATFIVLGNFTEQGIRKVKDTTKRAEAFRTLAKKTGATIREIYWTMGQFDIVVVIDAPNEQAATALLLSVGALGNVHSQTLRAFTAEEMDQIIAHMK